MANDGGAAFPHAHEKSDHPKWSVSAGMSLRDYFAAQAMMALIQMVPGIRNDNEVASEAYELADAMLKVAPGAADLTSFGSVLDWMISGSFLRVDTLDPNARHKRYLECKLCAGTDAERNHPRPAQASVKHAEGCEFAKYLPRLRAMANKGAT